MKMRRQTWTATLVALLLASGLAAQEVSKDESADDSTQPRTRKIRVLQHPYDLASFYRASDGSGYGYGFFGYASDGRLQATGRYPIASYYRSDSGGESVGYWRAQTWRRSPSFTTRHRRARAVERHGELYLLVPTFLAPLAPLAEEPLEREGR
jgi:hypothetical protein